MRRLGREYTDYETAMKYRKKEKETSNLESGDESRKHKKPSRYRSSESDGADDEEDADEDSRAKVSRRLRTPTPPRSYKSATTKGSTRTQYKNANRLMATLQPTSSEFG